MHMNRTKQFRILAVLLSTKGFGYAVMEGENTLIDYGNKVLKKDKNIHSLIQIKRVIAQNQPDVLVLQDDRDGDRLNVHSDCGLVRR